MNLSDSDTNVLSAISTYQRNFDFEFLHLSSLIFLSLFKGKDASRRFFFLFHYCTLLIAFYFCSNNVQLISITFKPSPKACKKEILDLSHKRIEAGKDLR